MGPPGSPWHLLDSDAGGSADRRPDLPVGRRIPGIWWTAGCGWSIKNAAGVWVGDHARVVAARFARGLASPTKPVGGGAGSNPVHPNAILIFQQQADRNASGSVTDGGRPSNTFDGGRQLSQYSWYPDQLLRSARGLPPRRSPGGHGQSSLLRQRHHECGRVRRRQLRKWLLGTIPGGSGPLVSYSSQNGYLVYFSDRRGMLPDPNNGNITSGEYGFEDVINSASPTGTPDGVREAS